MSVLLNLKLAKRGKNDVCGPSLLIGVIFYVRIRATLVKVYGQVFKESAIKESSVKSAQQNGVNEI